VSGEEARLAAGGILFLTAGLVAIAAFTMGLASRPRKRALRIWISADVLFLACCATALPDMYAIGGVGIWIGHLAHDVWRYIHADDDDDDRPRRRRRVWRLARPRLALPRVRRPAHVLAAAAFAVAAAACTAPGPAGTLTTGPGDQLDQLTVAVEDTGAHYDRKAWGDWTSHGGCTTRETVLAAQGDGETVDGQCRPTCPAATEPCWTSSYDGVRTADPAALQIDHLVPLAEAQRSGARGWDAARRHAYYNDPANLVAVTVHANTSKGDQDPGRWRPSARESWCAYAAGWVAVKTAYGLSVDPEEKAAVRSMLTGC
jgi:hypothetical protein